MATRRSGLSSNDPNIISRLAEMARVWNGEGRKKGDRVVQAKELGRIQQAFNRLGINPGLDSGNGPGVVDGVDYMDRPSTTTTEVISPATGVTARGGFRTVVVSWDYPSYRGHSQTEVWRSLDENFSNAILVATTGGAMYSDPDIESDTEYWYWIRYVNRFEEKGALGGPAGTRSAVAVEYLIEQLSNEINESALSQDLREWKAGLDSQYTLKVSSVNGAVAGIGLASTPSEVEPDGQFSEFYVNADRFAVLPQTDSYPEDVMSPFIVEDGHVYINSARIADASIKSAQIADLTADKIVASDLSAVSADLGFVEAGRMQSPDGKFIIDLNGKEILITV